MSWKSPAERAGLPFQLAEAGYKITGFDLSSELLDIARNKTAGQTNPDWVLADMRTFELDRKFGVIISPGHSFQFMNTPEEQVTCLSQIKRHLISGGWLILHLDHQDVRWLAELLEDKAPEYSRGQATGTPPHSQTVSLLPFWQYQPATETATATSKWEEVGKENEILGTWEREPNRLHCAFRSEIEHLLIQCGFTIEALYGDFYHHPLEDKSENMIWVARI